MILNNALYDKTVLRPGLSLSSHSPEGLKKVPRHNSVTYLGFITVSTLIILQNVILCERI